MGKDDQQHDNKNASAAANSDQAAKVGAPPSAAGPAGAHFEGKVGAFYVLSLLAGDEPRGLPGATPQSIKFQQATQGRPFDDITVDANDSDGSPAFLDIQAKRTIDFTKSNHEFADIVERLWKTAQLPSFSASRYEVAVAIARTSTRIERDCQAVLHWARQLASADEFAANMQRAGFSSQGMRDFLEAFKTHLAAAGAPTDGEIIWRLLRRLQILVFDFESVGSDFDHRARERARSVLGAEQANRASELWAILLDEALTHAGAGGTIDRPTLVKRLTEKHGFKFDVRGDLQAVYAKLRDAAKDALSDIRDHIGGCYRRDKSA